MVTEYDAAILFDCLSEKVVKVFIFLKLSMCEHKFNVNFDQFPEDCGPVLYAHMQKECCAIFL